MTENTHAPFPMGVTDLYRTVVLERSFDPLFARDLAAAIDTPHVEERYCAAVVFAGNRIDPPEMCDEVANEDTDYCDRHAVQADEYAYEDEMERRADARREDPEAW
jgi:hypothetical protein